MEPSGSYLPIHAFAGLYSSPIEQHMPSSSQQQTPKSSALKSAKNSHGPLRAGKRRSDTKEKHYCGYPITGGNSATGSPTVLPAQVQRRNERERNRVRQLNSGFSTLRQHVPNGKNNKKMSKVETLRNALEHISNLQALLAEYQQQNPSFSAQSSSESTSTDHKAPDSPESEPVQGFPGMDSYGEYTASYAGFMTVPLGSDFVKTEDDFPWI